MRGDPMTNAAREAIAKSRWKKVWAARPIKDVVTLAFALRNPRTALVLPIKHWSVTKPDRYHYCVACIALCSGQSSQLILPHLLVVGAAFLERVHLQDNLWAAFSVKQYHSPEFECRYCRKRNNDHNNDVWEIQRRREANALRNEREKARA